jgi:hypothetical protein
MINQLTVEVSALLLDVIVKEVPAVIVPTERLPKVPAAAALERKIREDAVTAVVATVTVPVAKAPDVPTEAFEPVVI